MFEVVSTRAIRTWFGRPRVVATVRVAQDVEVAARRIRWDRWGGVRAVVRRVPFRAGETFEVTTGPGEAPRQGCRFQPDDDRAQVWLQAELAKRLSRVLDAEWAAAG
jgi:hypothetical protein